MRIAVIGVAFTLTLSDARAQAPPPAGPCFRVIEGHADVPPAAPMLVDRCSGETFVLMRSRRGDDKSVRFEWLPIAKSAPGSVATPTAPAPPRPASSAKAATKDGCFTYNGRAYCP